MAKWIKMPLGTEVGLGPDDIVLDGDPAPPTGPTERGTEASTYFSAHCYCGQTVAHLSVGPNVLVNATASLHSPKMSCQQRSLFYKHKFSIFAVS